MDKTLEHTRDRLSAWGSYRKRDLLGKQGTSLLFSQGKFIGNAATCHSEGVLEFTARIRRIKQLAVHNLQPFYTLRRPRKYHSDAGCELCLDLQMRAVPSRADSHASAV